MMTRFILRCKYRFFDLIKTFSKAWIGLRKEDKAYYWVDGSDSVYHNWQEEHYTENQRESDTCTLVNEDGKWELERCEDKNYFICKQKLRKYFSTDYNHPQMAYSCKSVLDTVLELPYAM